MYRGTTPTMTLMLPEGTDFTGATVYVSLSDDRRHEILRIENPEIDGNTISLYLTQAQTLGLPARVLVQVNWTYGSGQRACSNIVSFDTKKNLIEEVL